MRAAQAAAAPKRRTDGGGVGAVRGRSRRIAALRLFVTPRVALLALAGCSGGAVQSAADPSSGVDPALEPARVVAEFLDAANRRDHAAMASRFGTAAGPIADRGGTLGCALRRIGSWIGLGDHCQTAPEIELRMDLMAAILAHESYRMGAHTAVVGRGRPAARIDVEVEGVGKQAVTVPFVLVQTEDGLWLVEEVALGRLVGG